MSANNSQFSQNNQQDKSKSDLQEIKLEAEKLFVKRTKKKIGEVVVRKEVETTMIEVPVRREKLIVEEVGKSETKQLAEIDLTEQHEQDFIAKENYQAQQEFLTIKAASEAINAIASQQHHAQKHHSCSKVRIQLIVENPELQETYQKILDSFSESG